MTWGLLSVELLVSGWILLVLVVDLLLPSARKSSLWWVACLGVILAGLLLVLQRPLWTGGLFQQMFLVDRFAGYFKGLFLLTTAVVILMTREFHAQLPANLGPFYLLVLTALLGMLVLASVNDLLLLFIGLELLTFSLYVMAAYLKTDTRSVEAGMKYLIMGSVSSGFLIFGIALLYGYAGSTSFPILRGAFVNPEVPLMARAGLLLLLAGLGFKIAMVPFHFWVPDVYEGAPTPVVALLAVGSKMAGVVAAMRVFYGVFSTMTEFWGNLLALLSAATILYGNLGALPQVNIKRLLGYSSIAHAGYLLLGLCTGTRLGLGAVGFYLFAYALSDLAVFFVVASASRAIGGDALDDYNGLSRRSPTLAASMFVGLLSLAGVPPLVGFAGKYFVLLAALQTGRLWLVLIGAINVAVSLYYYLLVIKRMYLNAPKNASRIHVGFLTKAALGLLSLTILLTGVYMGSVYSRILDAVHF